MLLKGLVDEDIVNYRKTSMFLAFPHCSFKCGRANCQNQSLIDVPPVEVAAEEICRRYLNNPITSAIVCGGLEPLDSKYDILSLIDCLRRQFENDDDIVIYTGYTEEELADPQNGELFSLFNNIKTYPNIVVKFGRYIPDESHTPHLDEVLGIKLIGDNQYARRIS